MLQCTAKINLKTIVSIFFCIAITGCASVNMQAVVDPNFTNPMNRLFVIINHGQIEGAYSNYLISHLKEEFSSQKIENEIRTISPLVLDESIYEREIESYEPDGILAIIATGGTAGPYGGLLEVIYDVSLFDKLSQKRIWRAQISARGGTKIIDKRMKIMAHDLVTRLSNDKLITSVPRSEGSEI